MNSLRLMLVAGARPNFMKVAPLIWAIQRRNAELGMRNLEMKTEDGGSKLEVESSDPRLPSPISYRLVHTGQHYDDAMSDVFFRELRIPLPDFNLDVGSGSHAIQTARIMERFEPVLLNAFAEPANRTHGSTELRSHRVTESQSNGTSASPPTPNSQLPTPSSLRFSVPPPLRASDAPSHRPTVPPSHRPSALPDWLVVVGDVNSTMACALVAAKLGVKIAHVEAGLRSFDRSMPEEINRLVTDSIADLLLTPSADADANLRAEGIPDSRIRLVGNVMIDTLIANLPAARENPILKRLGLARKGFVYVTLHRPANVDHRHNLEAIMAGLDQLAQQLPIVFPMHPRTRKTLTEYGLFPSNNGTFKVLEPVGYLDSLALTENARLVLTDSGGLQEESTYFRTPCLTLRPNTERPITVQVGSNRLTDAAALTSDLQHLLSRELEFGQIPPLWDGHAAGRIIETLSQLS